MPERVSSILLFPDGTVSFFATSELYGHTQSGGHVENHLQCGFVPLGDGCDYELTEEEKDDLKKTWTKMKDNPNATFERIK